MINFAFLDVAIGIVFVFLALSILVTWLQEILATILAWRAKHLINIIQAMFDPTIQKLDGVQRLETLRKEGIKGDLWRGQVEKLGQNAILAFYEHPLIVSLSQPQGWRRLGTIRFPSYIAAEDFSTALLDILKKAGNGEAEFDKIREGLEKHLSLTGQENHALKVYFDQIAETVKDADKQVEEAGVAIETWFNNVMERATGWYKRHARIWAVVLGMLVALAFNADSIRLTTELWENQALRSQVASEATAFVIQDSELDTTPEEAEKILLDLDLPIGWMRENLPGAEGENLVVGWIVKVLGWGITGLAISQGSSFWFDFLGKLVKVRDSGPKPENKNEKEK